MTPITLTTPTDIFTTGGPWHTQYSLDFKLASDGSDYVVYNAYKTTTAVQYAEHSIRFNRTTKTWEDNGSSNPTTISINGDTVEGYNGSYLDFQFFNPQYFKDIMNS